MLGVNQNTHDQEEAEGDSPWLIKYVGGATENLLTSRACSALGKQNKVRINVNKLETYLKGAAKATPCPLKPFFKVL